MIKDLIQKYPGIMKLIAIGLGLLLSNILIGMFDKTIILF